MSLEITTSVMGSQDEDGEPTYALRIETVSDNTVTQELTLGMNQSQIDLLASALNTVRVDTGSRVKRQRFGYSYEQSIGGLYAQDKYETVYHHDSEACS